MVITKIQSAVSARFLTTLLFAGFALVGCKEKSSDTPAECVDGTQDCPCIPDGGCDPAQPQLVCNASNVCVDPGSPDPGELNGACDETIACSTYEEAQLDCINGTCQLPDCLSGLVGCPCAGALSCDDPAVEGEVCIEGICQLEGCTPG